MSQSEEQKESDRELLRGLAEGRSEALRALTRKYGNLLQALARRILSDPADAEEVAADVLWQVWREAGKFSAERGSVMGWLAMITRSRALDRLRAQRALRRQMVPAEESQGAPGPGEILFESERREQVRAAVSGLPGAERKLLEMAYFDGLTQAEIAQQSGLPLGTVKTRIRAAMLSLRRALESLAGPGAS